MFLIVVSIVFFFQNPKRLLAITVKIKHHDKTVEVSLRMY